MKEFLREMLIEPFSERDWGNYILGIIMWLLFIVVIVGIIYLSVWLVDSSFMPIKEKEGIVTNGYIEPEHYTTTMMMSGKVMIPITTYFPTSYNIEIEIDGVSDEVSVDESYYRQVFIGQKIKCKYTSGRIKKSLYIKSLE